MKNNNLYLKKGETKKDLEIKKYKRRAKSFLILLIIIGAVLLFQVGQDFIQKLSDVTKDDTVNVSGISVSSNRTLGNQSNQTQVCEVPTWSKQIISFMDRLFLYPSSFLTKFFIFLGIVYVIQIVFSLAFDVIELILLAFVAVKRLVLWIYRKITGKSKQDETLKKIAELY